MYRMTQHYCIACCHGAVLALLYHTIFRISIPLRQISRTEYYYGVIVPFRVGFATQRASDVPIVDTTKQCSNKEIRDSERGLRAVPMCV